MGAEGGAPRGRGPAARLARAPLRRHRRNRGARRPRAGAAGAARPGRVVLRAPGRSGAAGRAVRARHQAVGGRGRLPRSAPAARPRPPRTGAHGRGGAHARVRYRRDQERRQRPRRLHARRPLPDGAGARPARLPRAGRLQHLRDRLRGRRRALRRRVDRRRPAERQHVGARRPPLRRLGPLTVVPRPARAGRLRARVRDPLSGGGARRRPSGQAGRSARRAARARRGDGLPVRLGAAAVVLARRRA